ncbi:peptidoglycan-binding protein [Lysinibacter sp. HNR]|uniref:efflux RND transporter periplasmic adaptor subunit n=1 Tax=Lysinibacter sp. HNR TaxID=3031408 RepID=UPI0024353129|nr:peptidoglycan-binding protein [Lysinibacter sp. HNR]WGD36254.1 HlyD family efflux transporter periplasmic adaptor subunit [Lysinibacter sp. HNR]
MRKNHVRLWAFSAVAVLFAGAITAGIVLSGITAPPASETQHKDQNTVPVSRGNLVEQTRTRGSLTYANIRQIGFTGGGIITEVPTVGENVGMGGSLFRVNNAPVFLFHGELPAWREFAEGMSDGPDIAQLKTNLTNLGFYNGRIDQRFDERLRASIARWQKSVGIEQNSVLDLGRIVFLPSDVRINSVKASVGDQAGSDVLTVSSLSRQVEAYFDTALRDLAQEGAAVTVQLPNGSQIGGTITRVDPPTEQENSAGEKTVRIPVYIKLDDNGAAEGIGNVSVTILATQIKREDVLLLPVSALLAQPGGGFAVEKATGSQPQTVVTVPVELGLFADGQVELTGGEIAEGDTVVVPE